MHLFSHRRWLWFWTVATILACSINVLNNLVYLPGGPTPAFLLEKAAPPAAASTTLISWSRPAMTAETDLSPQSLKQQSLPPPAWWLTALYLHIASASLCLVTGIALCFPCLLRFRRLHQGLGYTYVNVVLWCAAPTGLLMAPSAKGGFWGAAGFSLAAVWWWWSTWQGLQAILRHQLRRHVAAMTRSFAVALSAPAFRVIQAALAPTSLSTDTIYVASLWLSLLVSLWLSESWIQSGGLRTLSQEGLAYQ